MKTKPPTRRRRLSAEDAREAILAATEKRLREIGPDALRLQDIANDVGLSHPTVLHHVGSREELVAAVVARAMLKLEEDLLACFSPGVGPLGIMRTLHQIDDVMRVRGQARLVGWLVLTQKANAPKRDSRLGDVATAVHLARGALAGHEAPYEDTAFGVVLASAALFGFALVGPQLLTMVGLPADEAVMHRFREQFGGLLFAHAGIPVPPAPNAPPAKARGMR